MFDARNDDNDNIVAERRIAGERGKMQQRKLAIFFFIPMQLNRNLNLPSWSDFIGVAVGITRSAVIANVTIIGTL